MMCDESWAMIACVGGVASYHPSADDYDAAFACVQPLLLQLKSSNRADSLCSSMNYFGAELCCGVAAADDLGWANAVGLSRAGEFAVSGLEQRDNERVV